ncbi:hypothetical protein UFOVP611_12 [uncultured Caudovirales phage]|uniref:Uncharacterized protein n=1 Tax=uncultured Caudovirales phage TaxID=2100421 RepID=A0A6J5N009_9CAUD|nr:hypothetical protein UFOVP611_12 [uncultured Caudovirales phage]
MALGCNCNAGLSNTGRPNCVPIQSVTSSFIMVPIRANDGTFNRIDLTAPVPVWDDLVNEADASKRWFPLPAFENVELPKADTQFEEANSGRMVFLRQGKRSFAGELWAEDSTPTFLGKLMTNRCVEFGIYFVDVNGNLIGSKVGDYLYPIPVDNPSWDPKFMFATDTTTQKIMVGFDFDRLFDESTMYMITPTEAGLNFSDLKGLVDVNYLNVVENANTDLTFDLKLDFGTAYNPVLFKGGQLSDFELYNNTTATVETITSVIENLPTEGNYTLSFAFVTAESYTLSVIRPGFTGQYVFTAI